MREPEKANEGELTAEEQIEYEQYVEGIDLLGIFKAQARLALLRMQTSPSLVIDAICSKGQI